MSSVLAHFRAAVVRFSDRVAVQGETIRWTYAQLDELSDRVAAGLARAGIRRGDYVPVLLGRSPEFIAAILGIMKCGGVYVPVDPDYPAARRQLILQQLGAIRGLVFNARTGESGCPGALAIQELMQVELPAPSVELTGEDPIYVMFTSGSTGAPKGSVIPHRGVVRLILDTDYAYFGPDQCWGLLSSVSFDVSTIEIFGALLHGGICAVVEDRLPSLHRIAEIFARHAVTDASLTASLFNTAVDYRIELFRGLRQVWTGGEIESAAHFRKLLEAYPTVRLVHWYGPTENTVFSTAHTVTIDDVRDEKRVPIGRAIRGTSTRILTPRREPVAPGESGELYVGGPGTGLGYLGQPELTREKFVSLEGSSEIWYRTGDLVVERPDGAIMFLGRVDRQVKVRGHRIEPEEIEKTLLSFPGISAAMVDVVGTSAEDRRLVAYCAAVSGNDGPKDVAVRNWLADRLPRFMIPDELYLLPSLPLGTSGKVDRKAVLTLALNRSSTAGDLPLSADEHSLAEIWRELLPPATLIRQTTDFFEAGGHSVLVLKMIAEIAKKFAVELAPAAIYRSRTLGAVVSAIKACSGTVELPAEEEIATPSGDFQCGSTQRSLQYEWWLSPAGTAFHVVEGFIAEPDFDVSLFETNLRTVVAASDVLRSRIVVSESGIRQRFVPADEQQPILRFEIDIAWDGSSSTFPEDLRSRLFQQFDLERDSPLRAHVLRLLDGRWFVALTFHHSVIDDWSLSLILDALSEANPREQLSPTETSILRYVRWESSHADLEEARSKGAALAKAANDGYPLLVHENRAARETLFRFDSGFVESLDLLASEQKTTPFVVLLAAYARALAQTYNISAPWIVTPFANRAVPLLRGIIGCLLDLRPLQLPVASGDDFRATVRAAHTCVLREHELGPVPLEEVANSVRAHGVPSLEIALQFALTFRVDMEHDRRLGGARAGYFRVPMSETQFGVMLLRFDRDNTGKMTCIAETPVDVSDPEVADVVTAMEALIRRAVGNGGDTLTASPVTVSTLASSDSTDAKTAEGGARGGDLMFDSLCRDVWCTALKRPSVEDGDDFFECGGSSLLAVRLASALRQASGQRLDLAQFIATPTFARFRSLAQLGSTGSSIATFGDPSSEFVLLGVPGVAGLSISYYLLWRELSRVLGRPIRFYSVDFVALTDPLRHGASINSVVSQLQSITNVKIGAKRFGLVGYSLGGVLAVELAVALTSAGRAPQHVWLLDTYSPRAVWPTAQQKVQRLATGFVRSPLRTSRWAFERAAKLLQTRPDTGNREQNAQVFRDRELLRSAFLEHCPGTYSGEVTLLRSNESFFPGASDSLNGLKDVLVGNVTVDVLPVEHLEFLKSGVALTALRIASGIREICGDVAPQPSVVIA